MGTSLFILCNTLSAAEQLERAQDSFRFLKRVSLVFLVIDDLRSPWPFRNTQSHSATSRRKAAFDLTFFIERLGDDKLCSAYFGIKAVIKALTDDPAACP
jgi:hypothetical protein